MIISCRLDAVDLRFDPEWLRGPQAVLPQDLRSERLVVTLDRVQQICANSTEHIDLPDASQDVVLAHASFPAGNPPGWPLDILAKSSG